MDNNFSESIFIQPSFSKNVLPVPVKLLINIKFLLIFVEKAIELIFVL